MLKRICVTAATAAASLTLLIPATANAASGWWLEYSNKSTNLCMDVKNSSTANGAIVQEYTCKNPGTSGAANQQFQLQASGAWAQVVALHSGKCFDMTGWSTADGGTLQQSSCTGAANQQWNLVYVSTNPNTSENYLFKNVYSGKCITHSASGTPLYQVTCNSADPLQVWKQHLIDSGCSTCVAPRYVTGLPA